MKFNNIQMWGNDSNNKYINLCGLAIHIGSQIIDIKPFDEAFSKLRTLILNLRDSKD